MCCKVLLGHIWPSSSNTLWNKHIINNQTGWRNELDINAGIRPDYTLNGRPHQCSFLASPQSMKQKNLSVRHDVIMIHTIACMY